MNETSTNQPPNTDTKAIDRWLPKGVLKLRGYQKAGDLVRPRGGRMVHEIQEFRPGVLNKRQIQVLIDEGIIQHSPEPPGFSSLDLHLGQRYWRMKGGIKGIPQTSYFKVLADTKFYEETGTLNCGQTKCLDPQKTYVFQLQEMIHLKKELDIFAYATGKSSIGRLDVLTRMIFEYSTKYDEILSDAQEGSLFLEITPITFPIIVKAGSAMSQLRFFRGYQRLSQLREEELFYYPSMVLTPDDYRLKSDRELGVLRLDLSGMDVQGQAASAFAAKRGTNEPINPQAKKGSINPDQYWEPIPANNGVIEIEHERFYILRSKERFRLPHDFAVYCQAVSETLGELRIHYAGFVHPGFGSYREDKRGTPLIFEVRGHNVNTFLRDGEILAKIQFFRMSEPYDPTEEEIKEEREGGFENQELQLSKIFMK